MGSEAEVAEAACAGEGHALVGRPGPGRSVRSEKGRDEVRVAFVIGDEIQLLDPPITAEEPAEPVGSVEPSARCVPISEHPDRDTIDEKSLRSWIENRLQGEGKVNSRMLDVTDVQVGQQPQDPMIILESGFRAIG